MRAWRLPKANDERRNNLSLSACARESSIKMVGRRASAVERLPHPGKSPAHCPPIWSRQELAAYTSLADRMSSEKRDFRIRRRMVVNEQSHFCLAWQCDWLLNDSKLNGIVIYGNPLALRAIAHCD